MIAALLVFAATFAFDLRFLYPTIAPRDSADMAAAALTLGVAHPPGYPLYALLGKAWLILLPWGDPAYRLNALSAAAGAAACAGLFVLARRRAGTLGALTAAAIWALSAPLWKFSLLEEKYSLHALFAVVLLLLADGEREDAFARARLSGLVLGLGLVNHQSLLLWVPGLLWLWRARAARDRIPSAHLALAAAPGLAAGLALYAFVWVRLGALGPALAVVLRARYGAGTLSAALARPQTPQSAAALLVFAARGCVDALTWPASIAAAAGAALAWRADRDRALAWTLGAALTGPLFIVLSRFDPADWVARSVLEPAFLLPALILAAFASETVGALARRREALGATAGALLVAAAFGLRAAPPDHRDDFLAYDYVRELRRELAPGAPALVAGDTATFGLRWLDLVAPENPAPVVSAAGVTDASAWLAARNAGDGASVSGLSPAALAALGLTGPGRAIAPRGLVQRLDAGPAAPPAAPSRRPRAWNGGDSYVRDVQLSYAFSSWLTGRLLEARGAPPDATAPYDLAAVADDPADYFLP
jgi:hypothetical protein